MGFYQVRYLERVPPHAAVKDSRGAGEADTTRPPPASSMRCCGKRIAIRWRGPRGKSNYPARSGPLSRWESNFGAEAAVAIAQAALFLSRRSTSASRPPATACRTSVRNPSVPLLLESGAGLLDLCAAPNKTAQALEAEYAPWRAICTSPPPSNEAAGAPIWWWWTVRVRCLSHYDRPHFWWTHRVRAREPWGAIRKSSGGSRRAMTILKGRQLANALAALAPGAGVFHLFTGGRRERRRHVGGSRGRGKCEVTGRGSDGFYVGVIKSV